MNHTYIKVPIFFKTRLLGILQDTIKGLPKWRCLREWVSIGKIFDESPLNQDE